MGTALKKEDAKSSIGNLPENATWEDLMYEIYVREAVEAGLEDSKAGRLTEVGELRKEFGLPK
ncbi:MAG: hypothetical protein EPN93_07855 [Spirochaetes bacterium]|nr:MAG: hypothetical protein EPN93_07855 [Spirochaetota bacterium]